VKVLDEFLYPDLYDRLIRDIHTLSYRFIDGTEEAKKFEADLGSDIVQQVQECYEDKVGETEGFFSAGVVRCDPKYTYELHADHPSKLVSSVVYLYPETGNGTYFLKEDNGNQGKIMDEIVWHPNRLVTWANQGQLHMYGNKTEELRYTLNIYQKKNDEVFEVRSRSKAIR
jgi:hypothetical protein